MKINKKILSIVGISGICLSFLTSTVFAVTGTVSGTSSSVRIRDKASTNSNVISAAQNGEKVDVIGEEGNWYKVTFEGVTGYISKDYVSTTYSSSSTSIAEATVETPEVTSAESTTSNIETTENQTSETAEPEITTTEPETTSEEPVAQDTSENENNTQTEVVEDKKEISVGETLTLEKEANIRYLPSFSSRTKSKIASGLTITVEDKLNHWLKISDGNIEGWILAESINEENVSINALDNHSVPDNTPAPVNTDTTEKQGHVNVDTARIRISPNGEVIDTLDKNTKVTITGEEGDWYKINVNSHNGCYIAKRLITLD